MLEDFLFISYLKNKGIRRICFIIGLLLALFCFTVQFGYKIENQIYYLLPILFFYIPFYIAVIFRWIYLGFKNTKTIDEDEYIKALNGMETVYNPTIEADIKLNDSNNIYHCFAKNYQDNEDKIFVVVLFRTDKSFYGVMKINVNKERDTYDNFLNCLLPDTIFVNGKKVEEEDINIEQQ